ncbi:MAG: CRTAC1 family protein [Candidatus Magasanikbacteria bacterium]|nr:CRTAC1 family protein [Candidatus Magasanikbacteria bacterium]
MKHYITTILAAIALTLIAAPTLAAPPMTKTIIPTQDAGYINTISTKDNQLFVLGFGASASYDWQGQIFIPTQNHDISQNTGIAKYITWGDYDNDGDEDAFVLNYGGTSYFYQNQNGNLVVANPQIFPTLRVVGSHAQFIDIDNNGFLDLYISTAYGNNILFTNQQGIFTRNTIHPLVSNQTKTIKTLFFDIDNNGTLDAFLLNNGEPHDVYLQLHNQFILQPNHIFSSGQQQSTDAAQIDIDTDGDLDLFITNYNQAPLIFEQNNGTYQLTTISAISNLEQPIRSAVIFDIDNDADSDIYLTTDQFTNNILLENTGNGSFSNRTNHALTLEKNITKLAIPTDMNGDGAIDILSPNGVQPSIELFTNQTPTNNWLDINLVGQYSNKSALGAQIEIMTGGTTQIFTIIQNQNPQHIGIGSNDTTNIIIHWPSGTIQQETITDINTFQTIIESEPPYVKEGPIVFDATTNLAVSTTTVNADGQESITFAITVENTEQDSIEEIRLAINHHWNWADGLTPNTYMGLFISDQNGILQKHSSATYAANHITQIDSTKEYEPGTGITTYTLTIVYHGMEDDMLNNLPRVYIKDIDGIAKWYIPDTTDRFDIKKPAVFTKTGSAIFDPEQDFTISTSTIISNNQDVLTFTINVNNTKEDSLTDVRLLMNYRRWGSEGITPVDVGYFIATNGGVLQKLSTQTYGNQFPQIIDSIKQYNPLTGITTYTLTITYSGINENILQNLPFIYINEPEYANAKWYRSNDTKRFDILAPTTFSKTGKSIFIPEEHFIISTSTILANGQEQLTYTIHIANTYEDSLSDVRLLMNYRRWSTEGITPVNVGYFIAIQGEALKKYSASTYGNQLVEIVDSTRTYDEHTGITTFVLTISYNEGVTENIFQNLPFVYINEPEYIANAGWHRIDEAKRFDIIANNN